MGFDQCGNCKCLVKERSSKNTSVVSTWGAKVPEFGYPEEVSIYEALAVVFEIPPLTPNRGSEDGEEGVVDKKDVFEKRSKFGESGTGEEDEGGGFLLCSNCSEMLSVLYNSFQDFTAVCKLESAVGKILKELEKDLEGRSDEDRGTSKENFNALTTSDKAGRGFEDEGVQVKTEPVDDNANDENLEDDANVFDDFIEPSSPFSTIVLSDVGSVIKLPPTDEIQDERRLMDTRRGNEENFKGERSRSMQSLRQRIPPKTLSTYDNAEDDSDSDIGLRRSSRFRNKPVKRKIGSSSSDGDYVSSDEEASNVKEKRPMFSQPVPSRNTTKKPSTRSNVSSRIQQLKCPQCDKQFLHQNTLICHRRIIHRENIAIKPLPMVLQQLSVQNRNKSEGSGSGGAVASSGITSTCPVCCMEIPRNEIRTHLSTHTRSLSNSWMCTICGRQCNNHKTLNEHMKVHRVVIQCKRCGKKLPRVEFLIHMRLCSGTGPYACKSCTQSFSSSVQLMEHRALVHGHVWKCKVCGSKFSRRTAMIQHMQTHAKKKAFKCKICDNMYDRADVLRLHVKRFHKNEGPPSVLRNPALETGGDFDESPSSKLPHLDSQSQQTNALAIDGRFLCKPCDSLFRTFDGLQKHLVESHADKSTSSCNICKRTFQDNFCLTLHLRIHSETKPLSCYVCLKPYKEKNTLFYHLKDTHQVEARTIIEKYPDVFSLHKKNPNRPYLKGQAPKKPLVKGKFPCEICGKIFPYMHSVKVHVRIVHDKVKDFICSYCGKAFARKTYFLIHEKLHTTNDSPYKCHLCGKGFRLPGNLRNHLKSTIHNSKRDFICEVCGKGFNRMDNMKLHVKAVHMKIQIRKPRSGPSHSGRRRIVAVGGENEGEDYVPNGASSFSSAIPGTSHSFKLRSSSSTARKVNPDPGNSNSTVDPLSQDSYDSQQSSQFHKNGQDQRSQLSMPILDHTGQEQAANFSQSEFGTAPQPQFGFSFRGFQYR